MAPPYQNQQNRARTQNSNRGNTSRETTQRREGLVSGSSPQRQARYVLTHVCSNMARDFYNNPPWSGRQNNNHHHPSNRELKHENGVLRDVIDRKDGETETLTLEKVRLTRGNQNSHVRNRELQEDKQGLKQELQELKEQHDSLLAENLKVDKRYHELVDQKRKIEHQLQRDDKTRVNLESQNHELVKANEADQKTIESLKEQVIRYKSMISASTRQEDQATDDLVEGEAVRVFFSIQNFVVQNFRGLKLGRLDSGLEYCGQC